MKNPGFDLIFSTFGFRTVECFYSFIFCQKESKIRDRNYPYVELLKTYYQRIFGGSDIRVHRPFTCFTDFVFLIKYTNSSNIQFIN